jgi:hypothetical protein
MLCLHFDAEPEHFPFEKLNLRYGFKLNEASDEQSEHKIDKTLALTLNFIYDNYVKDWRRIQKFSIEAENSLCTHSKA